LSALPLPVSPVEVLWMAVPGRPYGKARPRAFRTRAGGIGMHMPDKAVRWEEHARQIAVGVWGGRAPLDEPLLMEVVCWFGRPQRLCRVKHRGGGPLPYTGKPDADNAAGLPMDALVKAGVMRDDTRVTDLNVRRRYLALDLLGEQVGTERTEIILWRWSP